MAALDFPNSPTAGQQYAGTNGVTYQWDGAVWATLGGVTSGPVGPAGGDLQGTYPNPTIKPAALPWTPSGATLTPTDATKTVTVPGSGGVGTVVLGSGTFKSRVQGHPTLGTGLLTNRDWNTTTQDDATKPSWAVLLREDADNVQVQRAPAGSSTQTSLLTLDNAGNLTWAGQTYARVQITGTMPSIPNNAVTALTWPTVVTNVGGMFSASTPDRFTIQQAGTYLCGANVEISTSTGGNWRRIILTAPGGSASQEGRPSASHCAMACTMLAQCTAGQVFQVNVYQDSGAALALINYYSTASFWITRVA